MGLLSKAKKKKQIKYVPWTEQRRWKQLDNEAVTEESSEVMEFGEKNKVMDEEFEEGNTSREKNATRKREKGFSFVFVVVAWKKMKLQW